MLEFFSPASSDQLSVKEVDSRDILPGSSPYTHRLESLENMKMALLQFRVLIYIQIDGVF